MKKYYHSVRLVSARCKGCVSCTRHCPTEAIRIRRGHAKIKEARCIDCGECIRHCPHHAKTAVTDTLDSLRKYPYNIALAAPSLYAQFETKVSVPAILAGLKRLGFNQVGEVAKGAEIATAALKKYLGKSNRTSPVISTACPASVRLILVKFPELIEYLSPIDAPVEIAARLEREKAIKKTGYVASQIGVWFITPCPAKMTSVKEPIGSRRSHLSGTISMTTVYGELLKVISEPVQQAAVTDLASAEGIGWAIAGGEASGLKDTSVLVAQGIHNVSEALEQLAIGKLKGIDFIECLACAGGCIGGPLTVSNRYVAESTLKARLRKMKANEGEHEHLFDEAVVDSAIIVGREIAPRPAMKLDDDITKAIAKVEKIDETVKLLPGLDCGSCGSPTCRALAEDIVQGQAVETDCVFYLRERVRDLAQEMMDLAAKMPPSLSKESHGE